MAAMQQDPVASSHKIDAKTYREYLNLYLQDSPEACDYGLWRARALSKCCFPSLIEYHAYFIQYSHWLLSHNLTFWPKRCPPGPHSCISISEQSDLMVLTVFTAIPKAITSGLIQTSRFGYQEKCQVFDYSCLKTVISPYFPSLNLLFLLWASKTESKPPQVNMTGVASCLSSQFLIS